MSQDYLDTNPVVHAGTIMDATAGRTTLKGFDWIGLGCYDVSKATTWMLTCTGVYVLAGLLFAWRAKCRLRRKIF